MAQLDVTGVKNGVYTLIGDNSSTILSGITHQGQVRSLETVTRTQLTPPLGGYHIGIFVPRSFVRSRDPNSNLRHPTSEAVYVVQIEIYDEAFIQSGEQAAYETMHLDFSTLYQRLVNVIRAQNRVTTTPCTVLQRAPGNDRLVTVLDVSRPKNDAERGLWALLQCMMQFSLVDQTM